MLCNTSRLGFVKLIALVVSAKHAEVAIRRLIELHLLHSYAKVHRTGHCVYLPLVYVPDDALLPPHRLDSFDFEELPQRRTIKNILGYTPSFDAIGDIAILPANSPNPPAEAEAILSTQKNIHGVFQSIAPVSGEFRTRILAHIKGECRTKVKYQEYGLVYELDVAQVYFTPRLATEHHRIAGKVVGGVVVDMFAGIGPFSIPIAKKNPNTTVIAIDKNRNAVRYLKQNIKRNKTKNVCAVIADSMMLPLECNIANHLIMNLPHSADQFLDEALRVIKNKGIIYYYDITTEEKLYQASVQEIETHAVKSGCSIEVVSQHVIRSYSPHHYNICIEARVHNLTSKGN
ncbi:MAG: class I SAM-dependent methyltransferase family protein [Methanosarcinales archaeon]|nr:MAG: class I SAM-dependent methyltransferase family protein [Methanosarcinales archaeon]